MTHLCFVSIFFFFSILLLNLFFFFFFNDTATTEIYTLSLHDALPISHVINGIFARKLRMAWNSVGSSAAMTIDRKSTRLNSSHLVISYAVFCLKKKKKNKILIYRTPSINVVISTEQYSHITQRPALYL